MKRNWGNITIDEYQYLYGIINNDNYSDSHKELKCISKLFDLPEDYLLSIDFDKYQKLSESIQFLNDDSVPYVSRIELIVNGKEYNIVGDARNITFGQYVDVTTFMNYDGGVIGNIHLMLASLCKSDIKHNDLADVFLQQNFFRSFGFMLGFLRSYDDLNKSYSRLFNISDDNDDTNIDDKKDTSFHNRWGWVYNAEMLRDFFKIDLKSVWDLNVIEALNGLAYLKDKSLHEKAEIDKMNKKYGK